MKQKTLDDLILFSRIISLAPLLGGYILAGLYIGKQLSSRGWPHWFITVGALLGALIGGAHAATVVRGVLQKRNR